MVKHDHGHEDHDDDKHDLDYILLLDYPILFSSSQQAHSYPLNFSSLLDSREVLFWSQFHILHQRLFRCCHEYYSNSWDSQKPTFYLSSKTRAVYCVWDCPLINPLLTKFLYQAKKTNPHPS